MPPLTDEGFIEEVSIMSGHEGLGIESVQEREGIYLLLLLQTFI
jgi:hypothetical protein